MESFLDAFSASVIHDRSHPAILAELDRLANTFDPERRWVQSDGYTLSDRIWLAGQETRAQIDGILKQALATGEDALVTARKLETYLNPALAPVRDARGKLVRDSERNRRKAIVTGTPGRGGRGSFAARRLARTEISAAHAQAHRQASALNPWSIGDKWNVSSSHVKSDACNDHANRNSGLGKGVYRHGQGPRIPLHAHCRCFWTTVVSDDTDGIVDAIKFRYQLGEFDISPPAPRPLSLVDRAIAAAVRLTGAVFGRAA